MRINSIGIMPLNNVYRHSSVNAYNKNININRISFSNKTSFDCISFSGKFGEIRSFDLPMAKSENVEKMVELGKGVMELLENGAQDSEVKDFISSKIPFLEVADMDAYRIRTGDSAKGYYAYNLCDIDDDFNCLDNTIYLDFPSIATNKGADFVFQNNLLLARTIAHESTHALQFNNGEYKEFMSEIADGSGEKAKQLEAISKAVFQTFDDDFLKRFVRPFVDSDEINNSRKYGFTIPREIKISEGIFLQKSKIKTADFFKDAANREFDSMYSKVIDAINGGYAIADDGVKNLVKESMKTEEGREKLKADIKHVCQYKAIREQEAYTAESEFLRSVLKTDNRLNADIFPIYYKLLSEAFLD